MTIYQAKFDQIIGASNPDEYDTLSGSPSQSAVVSRTPEGMIVSIYSDDIWDLWPYSPPHRHSKLDFALWSSAELTPHRKILMDQMKWFIFILIYFSNGTALKPTTLRKYLTLLRDIARYADQKLLSIQDILENPEHTKKSVKASNAKTAKSLILKINHITPRLTGFNINSHRVLNYLSELILDYSETIKQTLPIPTAIYSEILYRLTRELDDLEKIIDGTLQLLEEYCASPPVGQNRLYKTTYYSKKDFNLTSTKSKSSLFEFPDLLEKYGLDEIWKKKKLTPGIKGLSSLITQAVHTASLTIQAFTGMRGEEADELPYDCLQETKRFGDDSVHYIVQGLVTKAPGGTRVAQWITSSSGRNAIVFAQKISSTIYRICGDLTDDKSTISNERYLFVSPTCVIGKIKLPKPIHLSFEGNSNLRNILDVTINEGDIAELDRIDDSRDWTAEGVIVGSSWKLRRHQLRRSLALYAHASGLVTMPSLKRQLQHITQEMALYYCNGSPFANRFIGEGHAEKHFGTEWRETKPISEGLAYIANVLLTDQSDLFGPHPLWNQLHRRDQTGIMLVSREETLSAFKKGLLSYKETPLGGCANPEPCEKIPLSILHLECIQKKCKHLIGSFSKSERLIKIKEIQVKKLEAIDPLSFDAKVESEELRILREGIKAATTQKQSSRREPK